MNHSTFNGVNDTSRTEVSNGTVSLESGIGFETLYPALVQVFGIIAMGYISGR